MIITTENLVKNYILGGSTVTALNRVSLTIEKGDMLAITGPSGSGKSTLMNMLGCLDRPDSGSYILDGSDVSRLSKDRLAEIRNKKIGFVFQVFSLIPRTTALENVELPLLYSGRLSARREALESLAMVGLADRVHHEPNQLSGGERQRVAIARALVTKPSILLADEPTGNLDSKTGAEVLDIFTALNDSGLTMVVVTHDPDVASRCKRVLRIVDGAIVSDTRNRENHTA
jgi:putative ABC transport system ATP-binding protein